MGMNDTTTLKLYSPLTAELQIEPIDDAYSKQYYEEHEDEIKLCKASKKAFDELLPSSNSSKTTDSHKKKLPSLKELRAEYAKLLSEKKAAYAEYYKVKDEYRELLTYQANLSGLFGIENAKTEPQKERQQKEK